MGCDGILLASRPVASSHILLLLHSSIGRNRLFPQCEQTEDMPRMGPALRINIINNGRVCIPFRQQQLPQYKVTARGILTNSRPVIKHHDRSRTPPDPGLEVMSSHDMVQQEFQKIFRLGLLHSLQPRDELAVEEEASLACDGVHADYRVLIIDYFFPHKAADASDVVDHLA